MVDSKTVVDQVQELQIMFHDIHAEGMQVCETFQVATLIENCHCTRLGGFQKLFETQA